MLTVLRATADKIADKGASDDDPIESEREIKPPDFCLDNVKNESLTGEKSFTYKCLRDGTVNMSKTIAVYKALTNFV